MRKIRASAAPVAFLVVAAMLLAMQIGAQVGSPQAGGSRNPFDPLPGVTALDLTSLLTDYLGLGGAHATWLDDYAESPQMISVVSGSSASPYVGENPVATFGRFCNNCEMGGQRGHFVFWSQNNGGMATDAIGPTTIAVDTRQLGPVRDGMLGIQSLLVADQLPYPGDSASSSFAAYFQSQGFVPRHDITALQLEVHTFSPETCVGAVSNNGAGLVRIDTRIISGGACSGAARSHLLETGSRVRIVGAGAHLSGGAGPTDDAVWTVTKVDADTIDLQGSVFASCGCSTGTGTQIYYSRGADAFVAGERSHPLVIGGGGTGANTSGIVFDTGANPVSAFYNGIDFGVDSIRRLSTFSGETIEGVAINCQRGDFPCVRTKNNQWLQWRNAAGTGNLDVLSANASDDTLVNTPANIGFLVGKSQKAIMDSAGRFGFGVTSGTPGAFADVNGDISTRRQLVTLVNGANHDIARTNTFVKITGPTGAFSLGGFQGGSDGKHIWLLYTGTQVMTISHEAAGSTAANRINTLTGVDYAFGARAHTAHFIYDAGVARWILVSIDGY